MRLVKVKEEAATRQQIFGAAHFHNPLLVDCQDPICLEDGDPPMGLFFVERCKVIF